MSTVNPVVVYIVAGASYVSPGVMNDGGGYVIVNGRVIKVPPREPSSLKMRAAYQILEDVEGVAGAEAVKSAAEKLMISAAAELVKERELG